MLSTPVPVSSVQLTFAPHVPEYTSCGLIVPANTLPNAPKHIRTAISIEISFFMVLPSEKEMIGDPLL
jgi:hypothetical protein